MKKEWHWMSEYKNKIGVQGGDYYKPVEYKSTNKNKNGQHVNKRQSSKDKGS
tara:strand:- start:284 stop:439 length:156 start_codon:yes stop_codon:yes gene_type:complete